jgi:hypothetical protein
VAAGGAGLATANASSLSKLRGSLVGIYVRYNDSPPASTDVFVTTVGAGEAVPSNTLLELIDANTDGLFYPRFQAHDVAGTLLAAEYSRAPIDDYINVLIREANDGDSVDVWFLLLER